MKRVRILFACLLTFTFPAKRKPIKSRRKHPLNLLRNEVARYGVSAAAERKKLPITWSMLPEKLGKRVRKSMALIRAAGSSLEVNVKKSVPSTKATSSPKARSRGSRSFDLGKKLRLRSRKSQKPNTSRWSSGRECALFLPKNQERIAWLCFSMLKREI